MEYTLEDALETLRDVQKQRLNELEHLTNLISNNDVNSLNQSSTFEEIRTKQRKLHQSLLTHVSQEEPRDYPVPRTSDLHVEALAELEENTRNSEMLLRTIEERLAEIQEDITYLESKKLGLEKMKEAYLGAAKTLANTTYEKECATTRQLFRQVKKDLSTVVDIIFPESSGFQELLAQLTLAHSQGGDNVYVDITPEVTDYVNFLFEADIVTYHPNDKRKIKLVELL